MESKSRSESSVYMYPSSNIYTTADTISIASYEEIFTLPWKTDDKELHSYITFDDSQRYTYTNDDASAPNTQYRKQKLICQIPKYVMMVFSVFMITIAAVALLNTFNVVSFDKNPTVPQLIPYEGENWFVRAEQWGMKLYLKNCSKFKKVTKVTVHQIKIDDKSCNDIKACTDYLCAYDRSVSVLDNGELEYEFFFGNDIHVFEGRDWNCPYNPGEIRLGYLGNNYDPKELGPSWGNIQYTIIQYGILNGLVAVDVCYDVDPDHRKC